MQVRDTVRQQAYDGLRSQPCAAPPHQSVSLQKLWKVVNLCHGDIGKNKKKNICKFPCKFRLLSV
jgi:hypothetical protein